MARLQHFENDYCFVQAALDELHFLIEEILDKVRFSDPDSRAVIASIRDRVVHCAWALADDTGVGVCDCHLTRSAYRRQLFREVAAELHLLAERSEAKDRDKEGDRAAAMKARFNGASK
jgi:hypothetical protein